MPPVPSSHNNITISAQRDAALRLLSNIAAHTFDEPDGGFFTRLFAATTDKYRWVLRLV